MALSHSSGAFGPNENGCPYMHGDPPGVCNKCGWITPFPSKGTVARAYEMFEARLASLAEEKPDSEPTLEDWHEAMRAALAVIDRPLQLVTPFTPDEVEALIWASGVGWASVDDGFPWPRDGNRAIIESAKAKLEAMRG